MTGSPFTIALTGGIASGKSTVTRILAEQGASIIDADEVARELVGAGQPALAEIVATFGREVLDEAGRLDRAALRARVFAVPADRARIERILHPRIRREMWRRSDVAVGPYCVLAIPLLLETNQKAPATETRNGAGNLHGREEANLLPKDAWRVDRVLVVDTTVERQIARARRRDGSSVETIKAIIATQATRAARLAVADDVIRNDGDLGHLRRQTLDLHHRYPRMARYHRDQ